MFIRCFVFCVILFALSCCKQSVSEILPEYKIIKTFSENINSKIGLVLCSYGVNQALSKDYKFKNGVVNFNMTFSLSRTQKDPISLEEARCFIVSIEEDFLRKINSNLEIRPLLDVYPVTSDLVSVGIRFEDENRIDLGSGISGARLFDGKIKYERYEIREYRSKYPSIGEHFVVHQESYAEALDIVKSQGALIDLGNSAITQPKHQK